MLRCSHGWCTALTAARKTTLNCKSKPWGGLEQLPEQRGAGSLPFPVHMDDVCSRIMGGIAPPPQLSLFTGLLRQTEKQGYRRPGPLPAAQGAIGPAQLQGFQLFLPGATGLHQWAHFRNCDTQVSQLYLLHQPLINNFSWTLLITILGNIMEG